MNCIKNTRIITMDSSRRVIERGFIKWQDGVITEIGEGECGEADAYDAHGLTLYPGFVDAHTHLGLTTNGVGEESDDFNEESEPCTPHMHIIDGINPFDISFSEALKAGMISYITEDVLEAVGEERDPLKAVRLNVLHGVDRIRKEFAEHPEIGKIDVRGAVYDIECGTVEWL